MFGYITQDEAVADGFTHSGTSFFVPVWIEIDEEGMIVEVEEKWNVLGWFLRWCWRTEKKLFPPQEGDADSEFVLFRLVVKKKIDIGSE